MITLPTTIFVVKLGISDGLQFKNNLPRSACNIKPEIVSQNDQKKMFYL